MQGCSYLEIRLSSNVTILDIDLGTLVREDGLNSLLERSQLGSRGLDVLLLLLRPLGQGCDDIVCGDGVLQVISNDGACEGE